MRNTPSENRYSLFCSRASTGALLLLFLFLSCGLLSAETIIEEPHLFPMSPEIMAQGGSYVAVAEGYNSIFTNPAGFAEGDPSLTLPSLNFWVHANPLRYLGHFLGGNHNTDYLLDEATDGGFGIGAATGLAYVGNGLGLGLVMQVDSFIYGPQATGLAGDTLATLSLVGGYAVSFNILGVDMSVGAALRPFARIHTPLSSDAAYELLTAFAGKKSIFGALNNKATLHGTGLGIDLGLIAKMGSFRLGVSFRDVGNTPINYKSSSFETVISYLGTNLVFPEGNATSDTYVIPMTINAGLAFYPMWGNSDSALDIVLHSEIRDLAAFFEGERDMLTHLHVGAEVRLWESFALRGGLNQGYVTFGLGLELSFVKLDLAYFTRELGDRYGESPSSGFAFELALQF